MNKLKMTKPSEGYFHAKCEIRDAVFNRIRAFEGEMKATKDNPRSEENNKITKAKIETLEEVRSFIRNVMLWDTGRGA